MAQTKKSSAAVHRERRELVNLAKSMGWQPGFVNDRCPIFGLIYVGRPTVLCVRTGGGVKLTNHQLYQARTMKRWPPLEDLTVLLATIQLTFTDGRPMHDVGVGGGINDDRADALAYAFTTLRA